MDTFMLISNGFFIVCLIYLFTYTIKKNRLTKIYKKENDVLLEEFKKLRKAKKSSEVRLGKIGEQLFPFLHNYPYDAKDFRFIGSPIDGIQFEEDVIVFVEVKTGNSKLTSKQKHIKSLIKRKKVRWLTVTIK